MTALMPDRTRPSAGELRRDLRHRRPLVLLAPLAGASAAASTLMVCLALGVAGWFLTDAGTHGTPRDGLWVGALAWLTAHGSGVHVGGTLVSAMPLGITLVCGWATWQCVDSWALPWMVPGNPRCFLPSSRSARCSRPSCWRFGGCAAVPWGWGSARS